VLIEAGRIRDVVPAQGVVGERLDESLILAPGFIDVQVNGGGGVLFNDSPDLPTLTRMVRAHRRFGTTALLPTLITDTEAKLRQAVDTVAAALAAGEPGIAGLHLEGPFLNPARRGVHRADLIRPLLPADLDYLRATTVRPLLLTLAPEMVSSDTVRGLRDAGIVVSIGHTDATYEQARDSGARGYTHLFNAMPPWLGRAPGPVGAALDESQCYAGLIVDGHHVHPASLRIALRALTPARAMLVTDAMASVGADIDQFLLQGQRIAVAGGRLTTADGTLAGAHLDMASAVRNAVALLDVPLPDALRMASATPADFLGIAAARGRLLPGRAADMVAITEDVDVRAVWVGGVGQSDLAQSLSKSRHDRA
jgi:N-acetylglucosamine-6-phosphate deacetylase